MDLKYKYCFSNSKLLEYVGRGRVDVYGLDALRPPGECKNRRFLRQLAKEHVVIQEHLNASSIVYITKHELRLDATHQNFGVFRQSCAAFARTKHAPERRLRKFGHMRRR